MQVRTRSSPVALENAMEAIANPRRRQILRLVWDAERSAGEIAAASDVSWPAVS
ncbi:MAG: winged helix-turn-helix transcriptional regulator, partial [Chloroflexi bacterium]